MAYCQQNSKDRLTNLIKDIHHLRLSKSLNNLTFMIMKLNNQYRKLLHRLNTLVYHQDMQLITILINILVLSTEKHHPYLIMLAKESLLSLTGQRSVKTLQIKFIHLCIIITCICIISRMPFSTSNLFSSTDIDHGSMNIIYF